MCVIQFMTSPNMSRSMVKLVELWNNSIQRENNFHVLGTLALLVIKKSNTKCYPTKLISIIGFYYHGEIQY